MVTTDLRKLLSRLNPACVRFMEGAVGSCARSGHYEATPAHLLSQLADDESGDAAAILSWAETDLPLLRELLRRELRGCRTGNSSRPAFSPNLVELLERSWSESSINLGQDAIRGAAVLIACCASSHLFSRDLQDLLRSIRTDGIREEFDRIVRDSAESRRDPPGAASKVEGGSFLGKFTVDLTGQAERGAIDPVSGRDDEIRQTIDILCRRRKNNPILVGEAGVGKTAVVEGIALRIARGEAPEPLRDVRLLSLDLGLLSAGAGVRGEFENRLKGVVREVKESPRPTILFIDEAHTLIGAGGEAGKGDAANLLKPELARGEIRCVAATTFSEFRRYLEKDPAIARRFQPVTVPEPDPAAAAAMLRGVCSRYEEFHRVRIPGEAIEAACELSHRFVPGRQLPDKAIDLLDTAAARVRMGLSTRPAAIERLDREIADIGSRLDSLERDRELGPGEEAGRGEPLRRRREELVEGVRELEGRWRAELDKVQELLSTRSPQEARRIRDELNELQGDAPLVHPFVTRRILSEIVEEWTGIPAGDMLRDEARLLLELEDGLNARVVGQPRAMRELAHTLRSGRLGLTRPEPPKAVLLLAGPSGVGKTETAKAIADLLYGGARSMLALSMSEYQDSISVTALKGASAGYVGYGDGGVLTEGVRRNPCSVVVLDEVEKAHRDVLNMFHQVFDQGTLRDGEGREVGFRDAVVVMTSNLGSETISRMASDPRARHSYEDFAQAIQPELSAHFQPSLLARCKVVPFLPLDAGSLRRIAESKLEAVARRLSREHRAGLACSDALLDRLVAGCGPGQGGARLLDSMLDRDILPGISALLLGRIAEGEEGGTVIADLDGDGSPSFRLDPELAAAPGIGA